MASEPGGLTFNRGQRLKQSREFARVRASGERAVQGCLIVNWTMAQGSRTRLGVVTSGKLGNAVIRGRARRLMRECFRLHQNEFAKALDLVLVARASIVGMGLAEVEKDFLTVARRAKLLKN